MAPLDWSQCPAVESIPGKVSGAWVFRGTRVPVSAILKISRPRHYEEVLENFHVSVNEFRLVLDFSRAECAGNVACRMKVILDESVPQKLRLLIEGGHTVVTTWFQGWSA